LRRSDRADSAYWVVVTLRDAFTPTDLVFSCISLSFVGGGEQDEGAIATQEGPENYGDDYDGELLP
jgi:hypothetical protein